MARVGSGQGRSAVDLGCGEGTETCWLLDNGWVMTSIDASADGLDLLRARTSDDDPLTIVQARVEHVELPPTDLVYAGYTLPYCPPAKFPALWRRITAALRPGGWLVGNLFGNRDTWAGEFEDMTFHTQQQAENLMADYEILDFSVREEDGGSGRGPKHWHVFDIVARHRSSTPTMS